MGPDGSQVLDGCDVLPPMAPRRAPAGAAAAHDPSAVARGAAGTRQAVGQRFGTLNTFVDFTLGSLSRAEVAVWMVLFRDTKEGVARTAQTDIARRAGVNVRTVRRAIDTLRRAALLTVVFQGSLRKGPSKYRVHPLLQPKAVSPP